MNKKGHRMHRFLKLAALIAIAALVGQRSSGSGAGDHFQAGNGEGCRLSSWKPEVYSVYGDAKTVLEKLSKFDKSLKDRRVYMFMVESAKEADLVLYERPYSDAASWKACRWHGEPSEASQAGQNTATKILEWKGTQCVGEKTKKLLESMKPQMKETTTSTPPTTAERGFGDVIKAYKDSYIRATLFLLC